MPLFLVADPAESTGLMSMAMVACLVLDDGSFNRILLSCFDLIKHKQI
jgi:hypothetical protein